MPWPLIVPAAISGVASIWGASKAAGAAKDASQQQAEAAKQALALQREMYYQTRSDLSPWMHQGQTAVSTLGSLMGLPSGGTSGTLGGTALPIKPGTTPPHGGGSTDPGSVIIGKAVPRYPATMAATGNTLASVASAQPRQTDSGYIQMRAPDGTIQPVPMQFVDHYRQLGAVTL